MHKGHQEVSKYRVNYAVGDELNDRNIIQFMDIHSHNTMNAFFSRIDDEDECYPGVFGVIGRLDKEIPDVLLRAGLEGCFTTLKFSEVFEEK